MASEIVQTIIAIIWTFFTIYVGYSVGLKYGFDHGFKWGKEVEKAKHEGR